MNIELQIEENMPLVRYIITKRFQPCNGEQFDRYLQAGRIALWRAISKFDFVRFPSGKLSTYAYPAILREILKEVQFDNKNKALSLDTLIALEFSVRYYTDTIEYNNFI